MSNALQILSSISYQSFNPMNDDPNILSNASGIYIIVGRKTDTFNDILENAKLSLFHGLTVLYIGISGKQGLKKRDYKNHFEGNARQSTLRKSLGALFNWQNKRVYYKDGKYKFLNNYEEELTKWMKENLIIFYWELEENISDVETELINELNPPLNIAKNRSIVNADFRANLSRLRK